MTDRRTNESFKVQRCDRDRDGRTGGQADWLAGGLTGGEKREGLRLYPSIKEKCVYSPTGEREGRAWGVNGETISDHHQQPARRRVGGGSGEWVGGQMDRRVG